MTVDRHPRFKTHFKKRISFDPKLVTKTQNRIQMFVDNPNHPLLRDHTLKGSQEGLRAFSITGDIRVIYRIIDSDTIQLLDIGTHNQVYR